MRWIPATERLPIGKNYQTLNIKYKGNASTLVLYHDAWFWSDNSFNESYQNPVDKDSWSAIEWLDEQSDEWISVEKELPEIYKPVLICEPPINDHDDWTMAVSYWDGTYEKINGKKLPRFPDGQDEQPGWHNAAYWELLPQPPKQ